MYTIDISTIGHLIGSFFALVGGAMRLDPAVFNAVQLSSNADLLTLLILILAGISVTLGQSVVLLANKVTPRRFVTSLLANGAIFAVKVLIWAAIFQLVTRLFFGLQPPFPQMVRVVGLAFAPLLLGFFILLPYLGAFLARVLDIWSSLAMLVALQVILHLQFWQALVCALIGLAIIQLLKYTIGRPIVALERWLKQTVAGVSLSYRIQELISAPSHNSSAPTLSPGQRPRATNEAAPLVESQLANGAGAPTATRSGELQSVPVRGQVVPEENNSGKLRGRLPQPVSASEGRRVEDDEGRDQERSKEKVSTGGLKDQDKGKGGVQ